SSMSAPAATASAIALAAWACAVTSRPCRCASSTAALSTSGGNWGRSWRVPAAGHDLDDVDAALGVLAHRGPDRADGGFGDAAQVVAVAAGGGDRRAG